MKVILSSRLSLNDAQLSALHRFSNRDSLKGARILFVADAVSEVKNNLPEWVYRDIGKFESLGAEVILCSLSESDICRKVLESDILFFEGGSTPKLLQAIKRARIMDIINSDSCSDKIWFGISAGSCVLSKKCYSSCEKWFAKIPGEEPVDGLCKNGDLVFIPHFNSKDFPENTEHNLKFIKEKIDGFKAVVGTDSCVVTGVIENNILTLNRDAYEAIFIEDNLSQ